MHIPATTDGRTIGISSATPSDMPLEGGEKRESVTLVFILFLKGLPVPVAHTPCLPNRHGQTTRVRSLPGPFGLVLECELTDQEIRNCRR